MLVNSKKITFLSLAMLFCMAEPTYAQLIVNTSIVVFDDVNESRKDITVMNGSDSQILYVKVEPYLVTQPGTDGQNMVLVTPANNQDFLVTPNKLIIPPKGRSIVRFLNLRDKHDDEVIYRVNFIPVDPPAELSGDDSGELNSRLNIVVAYQVLVIDMPVKAKSILEFERVDNQARFINTGNSNYLLVDGKQCNPVNREECAILPDRRVYPGNSWNSELPFSGPFTYTVRNEMGNTPRYFE